MLFLVLSVRTLRMRRQLKIALGDFGNEKMLRAMQVHSNFAEYAPLTLLLIFMLESTGGRAALIHMFCACLVVGRVSHAFGDSRAKEDNRFRMFGMAMTFTALAGAALSLIAVSAWPQVWTNRGG